MIVKNLYLYVVTRWWRKIKISRLESSSLGHSLCPPPNGVNVLLLTTTLVFRKFMLRIVTIHTIHIKEIAVYWNLGTAVDNSCFNRDIGRMYGAKESDNMRFVRAIMFLVVSVSPHYSPNFLLFNITNQKQKKKIYPFSINWCLGQNKLNHGFHDSRCLNSLSFFDCFVSQFRLAETLFSNAMYRRWTGALSKDIPRGVILFVPPSGPVLCSYRVFYIFLFHVGWMMKIKMVP